MRKIKEKIKQRHGKIEVVKKKLKIVTTKIKVFKKN